MSRITKSMRGAEVDFDLLQIRQQLSDIPAPMEVTDRENFVEKRLKRKLRNKAIPANIMPKVDTPTSNEDEFLLTDEE